MTTASPPEHTDFTRSWSSLFYGNRSLRIGTGAQVAAHAGVMTDVPGGERWAGAPAKPVREFFREVATLKKLAGRADGGEGKAQKND